MQSTKDKILSAVVAHIKDGDNLEQITISKIATEAEIGKSTVYEHFSSKEDLILETYQYLLSNYEAILTADSQLMDFKSAFLEQIERILYVMKDAKMIMNAIMNFEQETFLNYGKKLEGCANEIRDHLKKRFESIIQLGVLEGIIVPQIPKPYTSQVVQAIISGLLFQYVNEAMEIEETVLFELIYEQTLNVIKTNQA
ncbi:MAG: TetR/AcrR family transcriptional regulator [Bacillota bacterium]